jgi:hypothetical protein
LTAPAGRGDGVAAPALRDQGLTASTFDNIE